MPENKFTSSKDKSKNYIKSNFHNKNYIVALSTVLIMRFLSSRYLFVIKNLRRNNYELK